MNDTIAQRKARGYERLMSERDAAIKRAEAAEAAIAQAVQAEREACATLAGKAVMRVKTSTQAAHDMTLAEFRSVCSCAAEDAIRARNGAGRK